MTRTPHTFFVCPRWNDYREQTEAIIGTLTPENVVGKRLQNEAECGAIVTFIERVLRLKMNLRTSEDTYKPKQLNRLDCLEIRVVKW